MKCVKIHTNTQHTTREKKTQFTTRKMIFYMARKSKVNEYLLKKSYIPRGEERNESTQNMSCSCCIYHTSSYEKS